MSNFSTAATDSFTADSSTTNIWFTSSIPLCQESSVTVHFEGLEEVKMRGLYFCCIVDPEGAGSVAVGPKLIIAKSEEAAKLKLIKDHAPPGRDLDDLDIICFKLGDVRAKKEVQEVKVVK